MRVYLIGIPYFLQVHLPPLNLGYLAAVARRDGHEVRLRSLTLNPPPAMEDVIAEAKEFRPDIIGHTVLSPSFSLSRRLLRALRSAVPEARIVAGGPHPTALPDHAMRQLKTDYLVIGEGEWTFRDLLAALASDRDPNGIAGLAWWGADGVVCGSARPFEADIDAFPEPTWDLLAPQTYPRTPPQILHRADPWAPLLTSRGCPYSCSFCAVHRSAGRAFRARNPEAVVDEIERLQRDHGIREVMLLDPAFTTGRRHAVDFCQALLRRQTSIAWKPLQGIRIDSVDEELLALLSRAGCYELLFGIESFDQQTRQFMNKNLVLTPAQVNEKIKLARRYGIITGSFFILGGPGESEEQARRVVDEVVRGPLDLATFFSWTPLPGADDWRLFAEKIDLDHFAWETLTFGSASHSDAIRPNVLRRLLRMAHLRFYLRPRRWRKMIGMLRWASLGHLLAYTLDTLRGKQCRID